MRHRARRIRSDLDTTLFVEAGAGAGKTSSLVARIVSLVRAGVPITGIAAITFTEKAAAELRSRTRLSLEHDPTPEARAALDRLDHAPIGTLHSFARRMLFDFPIDAGLPPGFSVLDELESGLVFEEQWDDLLDRLLDEPDPPGGMIDGGRAFVELCEFDGFGINKGARRMADDFRANWDLVVDRVDLADPGPLRLDIAPLLAVGSAIGSTPVPPDDTQAETTRDIAALVDDLASADSVRTRLELIVELDRRFGHWGDGKRWPGAKGKWTKAFGADGASDLEALQGLEIELGRVARELLEAVRRHRRVLLGAVMGRFVLDAAARRTEAGLLEFHDLLVLARRLLTDRPQLRRLLHERYQRVLLDEFQDTDPIQLEIAVRLTADPDAADQSAADGAGGPAWRRLRPLPGRLFIVGDPKQSIYRFRRADIAQYLRAGDQVGADRVTLSANFRSTQAVIDFANDVFGRLITFEADAQPAFQPLDACRSAVALGHGTVSVLGADRHDDLTPNSRNGELGAADALRLREAADVAATVSTALADGWPVHDDALGALRPCRPGDICILLPTRISLPALESELRAARHLLPRRELIGRVRHRRDPPPDDGAARRRRSDRRADDGRGTAQPAVRVQRRGTLGMEAPGRLLEPVGGGPRRARRAPGGRRHRSRALGRRAHRLGIAGGPARVDRRRSTGARSRAGRPRRTRRLATDSLRGRAGPRLGRRRRPRRAPLPAVGDAAGLREPRRRHDPARDTTTTPCG